MQINVIICYEFINRNTIVRNSIALAVKNIEVNFVYLARLFVSLR